MSYNNKHILNIVCTVLSAIGTVSHLILTTISSSLINHTSFLILQMRKLIFNGWPLLHSRKWAWTQVCKIPDPMHIDYPASWRWEATVNLRVLSRARVDAEDPQPRELQTEDYPQKRDKQGNAI